MDFQGNRSVPQVGGALLGPLGAGVGGALAADDENRVMAGLGSAGGAWLGGAGGALAGLAGGGAAGAGLGALLASVTGEDVSEYAGLGGLGGAYLGGALGGIGGAAYGAGKGYDVAQKPRKTMKKESSVMSNVKYAYAIGALEKMAEHNVNPVQFVKAAARSRNPQMRKIASAIVAYDRAVAFQKQAGMLESGIGYATRGANAIGDYASRAFDAAKDYGARGLAKTKGYAGDTMALPANLRMLYNPGEGLSPEAAIAARAAALRGVGRGMILPGAAAGAGALGYGLMPEDSLYNDIAGFSNDYLGTDFDRTSRLGALFG